MRRTKIVATLGPATHTPRRIAELIDAGVNVVRLNFSHGTHDEHADRISTVRAAAKQAGVPVGILMDLQGPKIRTGSLVDGGPVELAEGQEFTITTRDVPGDSSIVSTTYQNLATDVEADSRVLLSDGMLELRVRRTTDTDIVCEVIHGGELREHQGINLPDSALSAPAMTEKDIDDLHFGLAQNVDFVAISFVRSASDVQQVKDQIAEAGYDMPVIAKIERPEAVTVLDDILDVADGVMVARGDLGVEMSPARVPIIQKQIIAHANQRGVPVITATQMLESMIEHARPTRAEASDVANAIIDGTDAVMLSGETAIGAYPIEVVQTMALIAEKTESEIVYAGERKIKPVTAPSIALAPLAIGTAASAIVNTLPIRAIVVFTQSGSTTRLISQQRPSVPVLAFTHHEKVYQRLSLMWGIMPILTHLIDSLEQFEQTACDTLLETGYARPTDIVVMTGGHPIAQRGQTNFLKMLEIS
jgi:pyruvate kinase